MFKNKGAYIFLQKIGLWVLPTTNNILGLQSKCYFLALLNGSNWLNPEFFLDLTCYFWL